MASMSPELVWHVCINYMAEFIPRGRAKLPRGSINATTELWAVMEFAKFDSSSFNDFLLNLLFQLLIFKISLHVFFIYF